MSYMAVIFLLSMIIVRTEVAEDLICNVQRLGGLGAGVVEWCWGGGGGGGQGAGRVLEIGHLGHASRTEAELASTGDRQFFAH